MDSRAPFTSEAQCRSCGTRFDERAWTALALSRRIDASEIARFLSGWPSEDCVEVRVCGVCASLVTRRRRKVA